MDLSMCSQLVHFYLLLQITIFFGELHHCATVTYRLSNVQCKGSVLDTKCQGTGEQLARITDLVSLDNAKQAIANHGIKYWTGLRYHKNNGYCWKQGAECVVSQPSSQILDTQNKASWENGWYCFLVDKNKDQLEVNSCSQATHAYICETGTSTVKTTTEEKLSATDQLRQYVAVISALNVSEETSLRNATETTTKLLRTLQKEIGDGEDINLLLPTQELEKFAISYGKIHNKANESKIISDKLFAIKIEKISADNKEAIMFSLNETGHSTKEYISSISLPPRIFKGQEAVVVSVIYNDVSEWIPDAKDVKLHGIKFTNLKSGSQIIASTVHPEPSDTLEENVTIAFSYDKEVKEGDTPHCVFWDFTLESKLNGSWASTGCSLVQRIGKKIICSCNHLTNFAVLMQVGHKKVPSHHAKALKAITYVGCGLSLVGELLTVLAYWALMNLKQEQVQIRFNLVVAIAIAQIVFLSGIDASGTRGVCVFVAALIHYFYLAGFGWMLFEGIYLYLMVVKVFNTVVRMRLFNAFAWGFPLFMVVLSLVIASSQDGGVNSYVHGDFCWISFTNNLIWTFAAPVLTVCLINATILARVLHEIMKMQSDKTSELEKIRQGLKACAVLFPLLGMTWVFGILSVTDAGLVFQYIFTILNSLQGLFIFLLHVLRNSDVQAAYLRRKQKWKESRSISTSRVASKGVDVSSNTLANEDIQELTSRKINRPCSSGSGYTNTSVLEQDRNLTPVEM